MASSVIFMLKMLVLIVSVNNCSCQISSLISSIKNIRSIDGVSYFELATAAYDTMQAASDIQDAFDSDEDISPDTSSSAMLYYSLTDLTDTWDDEFADLKQLISNRSQYIESLVELLANQEIVEQQINDFDAALEAMKLKFDQFIDIAKAHRNGTKAIKFCADFISNEINVLDIDVMMRNIYNYVAPELRSQSDILSLIVNNFQTLKDANRLCSNGGSPIDYVQLVFISIIIAEIQAYILRVAGTTFLYLNKDEPEVYYESSLTPAEKIQTWNSKGEKRIQTYVTAFIETMADLDTAYVLCPHSRGDAYVELESFIQYVIQPFYELSEWAVKFNVFNSQKFRRECHGYLEHVEEIQEPTAVCYNTHGSVRYHFVEKYKNPSLVSHCPSRTTYVFNEPFPIGYVSKCYDNDVKSKSTHVVNLLPVEADVAHNKIVTGMRFIVSRGVLHVQIRQGKIGPNFRVEQANWKPINDIAERVRASRLNRDYQGIPSGLDANEHYVVLDKTIRHFALGSTIAEHGHVITGLKFNLSKDKRLQLAAIVRKFDYKTGNLDLNSLKVILPVDVNYQRQIKKTPSSASDFSITFDIFNDGYVEFDSSDRDDEHGQKTKPMFDGRNLVTSPSRPLQGISTHLQVNNDDSGIIFGILHSLNYTTYMITAQEIMNEIVQMQETRGY